MDANSWDGKPRVSVVIPTLNEARNIGHVLGSLPDDIFEVVLVDGGSTDGTVEAARAVRPDIRIVRQPGTGKGDALVAGVAACVGDAVVMLDADGSTDPAEIPRFVAALLDGAHYVKGSRFLEGGGSSDISLFRRAGNSFFCRLVNHVYGTRYSDLCYGYMAAWRTSFDRLRMDCAGFEVETVYGIRSALTGLRVAEVPSFESRRLYGHSNLRPMRDGWRVLRAIIRERPPGPMAEEVVALGPEGASVKLARLRSRISQRTRAALRSHGYRARTDPWKERGIHDQPRARLNEQ